MDYSKMKQAQTQTKSNVKNLRRIKAMKTEARLRTALYYSFQLLVDTFIILVFIKGFSMSYNFGHDVFFDIAKNPKNTEYVYVSIAPDSSTKTIAETIYDSGVIKNKYVFMAKIKVNELGGKIKAGNYALSQSMTYNEILAIISGGANMGEVEYRTEEDDRKLQIQTPTDATQIHNNAEAGAGGGGEGGEGGALEGEDNYDPENPGESSEGGDTEGGDTEGGADGETE